MMRVVLVCFSSMMLLTSPLLADDMWFGVFGGPRVNSAGGTAVTQFNDAGGKTTTASGIGAGAFVAMPLSPQVKLNLGLGYSQRGYGMESSYILDGAESVQASDMSSTMKANYFDLMAGIMWYFLSGTDSSGMNILPYLGADVVPGFFLNGKTTSNFGGTESTQDISKDEIKSMNIGFRPNVGLDFLLSPSVSVGANLGYELGLTNVAKSMYEGDTYSQTLKFNGIVAAIRLMFKM